MNLNRKSFLEIAVTGGLGLILGGTTPIKSGWTDRGASLVSVSRSSLVMGSLVNFEVVAEQEEEGYEAIRRAIRVFRDLDRKLSMYDPSSEMGLLARHAGKYPVPLSHDSLEVLSFARQIWAETGGKFDVTIEPAMNRWGFRDTPGTGIRPPSDQELKMLEQRIGSDKLTVDGDRGYLEKPGMAVDLGGIAGGYALDRAIEKMRETGAAAAFINFSGDIHCFGTPLGRSGWPVYILNPYTQEPLSDPVWLHNEALSTSGAYENRRGDGGGSGWGHLLLPDRARPVDSTGSVTAIHPSAMAADAWSTAAYVGAGRPDDIRWIDL